MLFNHAVDSEVSTPIFYQKWHHFQCFRRRIRPSQKTNSWFNLHQFLTVQIFQLSLKAKIKTRCRSWTNFGMLSQNPIWSSSNSKYRGERQIPKLLWHNHRSVPSKLCTEMPLINLEFKRATLVQAGKHKTSSSMMSSTDLKSICSNYSRIESRIRED